MATGAAFDACWRTLKAEAAAEGIDITVSALPPLVKGPYTVAPIACPHGVTYWMEPTGEQIAQWVKDGVR